MNDGFNVGAWCLVPGAWLVLGASCQSAWFLVLVQVQVPVQVHLLAHLLAHLQMSG
jgi:hypothetical protein